MRCTNVTMVQPSKKILGRIDVIYEIQQFSGNYTRFYTPRYVDVELLVEVVEVLATKD